MINGHAQYPGEDIMMIMQIVVAALALALTGGAAAQQAK